MATELALQTAHTAAWKATTTESDPPEESERARRNLLAELKATNSRNNQGFYEIGDRTRTDLIDLLLQTSKPADRAEPVHIDAEKLVAALETDGWIHAGPLAPLITALIADPHRTDHVVDINLEQEPGPVTHHPITERFNIGQCPFAGLPDDAFTDVDWPDQTGRYRLTTDGTTIRFEPLT